MINAGEQVQFANMSRGGATGYQWTFYGGTPSTSTDENPRVTYNRAGSYDVLLKVTDDAGNSAEQRYSKMITVKETAPVAKIGLPSTFLDATTALPLIAAHAPVQFTDLSTGVPTEWNWAFTGAAANSNDILESRAQNPEVKFRYRGTQAALLEVANGEGSSQATATFTTGYSGNITNFRVGTDHATTIDMEDWGVFPGSTVKNHKFEKYAEKFSKPSRPMYVTGVNVYFNDVTAESITDQMTTVWVDLYTSVDGKPGERLYSNYRASFPWDVIDLNVPSGSTITPTFFDFNENVWVDDEFFVVVSGLPEYNDTCHVSFAMADLRDDVPGTPSSIRMANGARWATTSRLATAPLIW